jgi:hypothetical protein
VAFDPRKWKPEKPPWQEDETDARTTIRKPGETDAGFEDDRGPAEATTRRLSINVTAIASKLRTWWRGGSA